MNNLKISHHLCYMCHKDLSISSKKLYCRVYSLESGYLCDFCEKPFSTGYASKKPLPARSFGANRTKSVKMKQMKTTDRIPAAERFPTLNCAENGRRKPLKTTDRILDEICARRMPTLKPAEKGKRKQIKTTNERLHEVSARRMPTLKPAENGKRKQMKTTDRIPDEDSARRMNSLKFTENAGRKAVIADKLKEGFVEKLPSSKHVKSSKKEPDGQKILPRSSKIVGDVQKSNIDCHNIHNLDKMTKCVVRIRIDPSLVEKIMEYENRLKVQNRKRLRNRKK